MTADTVALWVALVVLCAGVLVCLSYKGLRAAALWVGAKVADVLCGRVSGGRK